jgi:hypothetical protein
MPASIGYSVPDITALQAIDASVRTTGYLRSVISKRTWYMFISTASDIADNNNIIQPISGTGRWFKISSVILSSDILDFNESVDDRISALLVDSSTLDVIYNDVSNSLVINIQPNSISDSQVNALSVSKITNLSTLLADKAPVIHNHNPGNITDLSEFIDDRVSALLQQGAGITLTYNDSTNTLTISGQVVPLVIKNEGVIVGNATTLNVVGSTAHVTMTGSEATFTIDTPPVDKLEILNVSGASLGLVSKLRFTGSGVSSITVASDTAVVDITGGNTGSSAIQEQNYTLTSSSISTNSFQTLTFSPEIGGFVRKITSDFFCRVRIYIDASSASNDLNRPVETELMGEHGCLFEAVLIPSNLVLDLSPPVILYRKDSSTPLSMTINNLDSTARIFNIVLNTLKW